ncbi:MAG: pantetheine-phosphate adenylyltransferase [Bacteroidetes bacterium HGW-Bacteroidetes-1]|jgi:pantetheine-phosphate adenylyltransferase|nr:MAG: pantetheine-phosphate adenylyltransferase [Bacteroidetes bacterium HGW-Bacteroidetes-1]
MKKKAVFPGSFDPITVGHEALVIRALSIFDEIVVAIGNNANKHYYFPIEKRKKWISQVFGSNPQVNVVVYEGLTVDFCREVGANFILRGLRTSADFEFERGIGQMNKMLHPDIESVFLLTTPELTPVTSSIIRDVFKNGGDVSQFIPAGIDLTI